MSNTGRNEPCHCGSGKKFKNCHQQIEVQKGSRKRGFIIGSIIGVLVILFIISLFLSSGESEPGEAPAGKEWSPEHGHWHTIK